jgi:pyrimidine deaminase RibD-like protein
VAAAAVEPVALSSPPVAAVLVQQQLVVGYALTKKKVNSFLQAKLLPLAK